MVYYEFMNRRERNKAARREQILEAAESLIRSSTDGSFSMRAVAAAAGLGEATPYNLFGSKHDIVRALFERSLARTEVSVRASRTIEDPIERLLAGAARWANGLARDATYHRMLFLAFAEAGDAPFRRRRRFIAMKMAEVTLAEAVEKGMLRSDTPVAAVARQIVLGMLGSLDMWSAEEISSQTLRRDVECGAAMTLLAFATGERVGTLHARINELAPESGASHSVRPAEAGVRR